MIYYATIVDVSGETGVSRWDYIHPNTPRELYEHLKGVRDYIPPMTYGIVSVVSKDLFGDRLRRMEFTDMQIVIGKLLHDDKEYYVFFLTDIKDHPKAVWKAFMDFYSQERTLFGRILSSTIVEVADVERLKNAFSAFLVNRFRKNPLLGARDLRSFMLSFAITIMAMSLLVLMTWTINHIYGLIENQKYWVTLTFIILMMHFILPGPIIGFITQYRRHAEAISITNGLLWAFIISTIYYETLKIGIWNSFHIRIEPHIYYIFVIISGLIYGAALMLSTVPFACLFEWRYLTTPRKIKITSPPPQKPAEETDEGESQQGES